jgi:hypothetical protein
MSTVQWIGRYRVWIALGIVLALPALAAPFFVDDYIHLAFLEDILPVHRQWWSLYTFVPGDGGEREAMLHYGMTPWWSSPELKLVLFRPLASALLTLDHFWFGRHALGWHLQSLLWWAALLVLVSRLYRRHVPAAVATLALAMFAIDDAHFMPLVWPAARNGLLATTFGLLGLSAHLRWRKQGWRPGAFLGPLGLALGLASSELAVSVFTYVLVYELLDGAGAAWRRRLAVLLPYLPLFALYALARSMIGAGAAGSGVYLDPTSDPLRFVWAAAGRIPALVGDLLWNIPAGLWAAGSDAQLGLVFLGLLALLLVASWLRLALRRLAPEEARNIRWLGAGALLSLLPPAAGLPSEHTLLPASIGAAPVLAVLVRDGIRLWRESRGILRRGWAGAILTAVALPNVVLAGPLLVGKLLFWKQLADHITEVVCACPAARSSSTRALLAWSDQPFSFYGWGAGWLSCPGPMSAWIPMSGSPHPQTLTRVSENALLLEYTEQPGLDSEGERLFRDPKAAMHVGTIVKMDGGLTITVQAVEHGRPKRVLFELTRPIEQTDFRLLAWQKRHLSEVNLRVGESTRFAAE